MARSEEDGAAVDELEEDVAVAVADKREEDGAAADELEEDGAEAGKQEEDWAVADELRRRPCASVRWRRRRWASAWLKPQALVW